MKPQFKWLIAALCFIALIVGSVLLYNKLTENADVSNLAQQGNTSSSNSKTDTSSNSKQDDDYSAAPDFTVYTADGTAVKLSDLQGKPLILNFWASWCGPCQKEMPDFQAVYDEFGEDIHFMMVNLTNVREKQEDAQAFIDKNGYTFPVYFDNEQNAATAYGVNSVPMSYFINSDGLLIAYAKGMVDEDTLRYGIEMILKD